MNDLTLTHFRAIADAMQTAPTNWEWVGPHMSQRMFSITQARAEAYAARHGGRASRMAPSESELREMARAEARASRAR